MWAAHDDGLRQFLAFRMEKSLSNVFCGLWAIRKLWTSVIWRYFITSFTNCKNKQNGFEIVLFLLWYCCYSWIYNNESSKKNSFWSLNVKKKPYWLTNRMFQRYLLRMNEIQWKKFSQFTPAPCDKKYQCNSS